ncbi:GNAT family N-acetyltransferase [Anaeromicropila herbilytica]|uniref:N-acetyltransferase n=1 Tax=Anaeromicropila herbilytica TaxID=2785025 RepID=A0A7R7ELA1_9FIRM|nr:GNAT family N-acetyltransferase [Anaeromicropila herbilytica]BCN30930.1 N-acetyltransferase [Anaeromicropila herbilytica]
MNSMVHIFFETKNLIVRQYTMNDVAGLYEVMSNPLVHQYTKDKNKPWDKYKTEQYIQFFIKKNFITLDCFHGAIIEKTSNKIIGLTGLNPYKVDEPEIEWKLDVSYWNKGYATEIGREIIKQAFKTTNITGIYGMADPENIASRRVLQKIGMKYMGIDEFRNQKDVFYYIGRV